MIGTIWYDDFTRGQIKLGEIKKEYYKNEVRTIKEMYQNYDNHMMMTVEFDNGDIWYLRSAYSILCGRRTNVSYIESTIPRDIIMHIIKPCAYSTPFIEYKEYTF